MDAFVLDVNLAVTPRRVGPFLFAEIAIGQQPRAFSSIRSSGINSADLFWLALT